jgi:hypothetical protein
MSHTKRSLIDRERQLKDAGLEFDRGSIRLHNAAETDTHAVVKTLLGLWIRRSGRAFATEVTYPDGSLADVLDYGPPDGSAVVYEIESNPEPDTIVSKRDRYCAPDCIRDMIMLDLRDAPDGLDELSLWVREFVVGV